VLRVTKDARVDLPLGTVVNGEAALPSDEKASPSPSCWWSRRRCRAPRSLFWS